MCCAKWDRFDLLKVDIEGAESEVLLDCGDELKRVKYLMSSIILFRIVADLGCLIGVVDHEWFSVLHPSHRRPPQTSIRRPGGSGHGPSTRYPCHPRLGS